ncbi:MAG TPA: DJ-1 family glyoxalase III [Ruminiclostridium sp.]|nr:DJ-1 family glyoxalase III [Ruminiclostridium sp.]
MVYVFLAEGFEETEAIVPIDMLRRSLADVKTVGVGGKNIKGAHDITVTADIEENDINDSAEMIVLPGGPGHKNLEKSKAVQKAIDRAVKSGALIGAICASPSILGHMGLLKGKKAVCYPGYENELFGAEAARSQVCEDGNIITANGPGASFAFGLKLAERLGKNADKVKSGMIIL